MAISKKPRNKKIYFTEETDDAIRLYNATEDFSLKSKIYESDIHYAFFKLTENIINTFKFHNLGSESITDFQQEVIIFLLSKIHLFHHSKNVDDRLKKIIIKDFKEKYEEGSFAIYTNNADKITQDQINTFIKTLNVSDKCFEKISKITPAKAYSYFGTIAKRYCIIATKKNYGKKIQKIHIDELDLSSKHLSEMENIDTSIEKLSSFMDQYVNHCMDNIFKIFPPPKDDKNNFEDAKIAESILMLFKRRDKLEIFNKKALYIHIRESVDVKTPKITKIAEKLYDLFKNKYMSYQDNGYVKF